MSTKQGVSPKSRADSHSGGLRSSFTPLGMWAFSIGTSIGWGSFIVTCNTYLQNAGILGTVFGLLIGMAVILVITWNLQYMIQKAPGAGGIYTFQKQIGGKNLGFITFWFVLLTYLAILWANMTSLPLFARFFLGKTFQFGFHYQIFGYEVWFGEALLSICAVILICLLCLQSAKLPNRVMIFAALTFAAGFTLCAAFAILRHDSAFAYTPLYTEGSDAFSQIIHIAAISPWAFIGFENISHFSEEYSFPIKKTRKILIWSVLATTLLYVFVSLLSISAYPPEYESWLAYIRDMGNLEGIKAVPAFYAADHYLGQAGVTVLMLSLFGVILTSLIGNLLALSRLLYAAGREGEAPRVLSRLNRQGVPGAAIITVAAISVFIPFVGRTAIGWIVDVTTLGATMIYGLISHAVYKHAQQTKQRLEKITGFSGFLMMIVFLLLLLIPGLLPFHAMETVSYILFIVWSVLGLCYYRVLLQGEQTKDRGRGVIVWIVLLVLVLFASMMWVSQATENAANDAVERIFEYHQSHPEHDTDAAGAEERSAYLQEQAKAISSTNTLYSSVSLGVFLLFIAILLNNYRDTQKLGERLNEAEQEVATVRKIAELKESISALLDNMPCLTFTKDAQTGAYLACNQAFADYAHKENPAGVAGLTDAQIFDGETAAHFVQDDRLALSMDKPYIFFEDVPDAAGNQKQLQTTKLKFIDSTGRTCLLGMSQDVTDLVRIQHENAMTKEAYENARSAGIMYTHIAQTLARDYTDMFSVNLDTEEFVEYRKGDRNSALSEMRRGWHFFSDCIEEMNESVYPDDQETFLKALDRRALMNALDQKDTLVVTYRQCGSSGPIYVSMKISRMEDDDRFIIVGITNVDAEMRDAMSKSEALAEALKTAEEANKAKTSFLSSMSHEIRTPMNAIIGLDTLALRDETLSEQTKGYLEKIGGSAKHLLSLINEILDMSRIESGRMVLRREVFSLSAMLEQINTMVMSQCGDKGLSYDCRVLNKVDTSYIGDDMKLKEVLLNILSNAVKFTEAPGAVSLTVEKTVEYEDQSTLRFCIKDTGIGMDKEFIPKIFDAFSQEDSSRKSKYGSTGLGMAITKRIVEMMNGSISVESEKGVGTEFTVTVTLRNCSQTGADRDSAIDPGSFRILVVDDDLIAAEHARTVLDEVGIQADVCASGEEALRMMDVKSLKHEPYNLVLMDWNMPGMNGLETSAEIRKKYDRETTVVVLTAYNWDDIHDEAERVGVDNFLVKPLFAANIIEELDRIARKNKMALFKEKKRADLSGRRILLAEDMEINAEIMINILELEGIEADHAENGRIAVEKFAKSTPGTYSAILMDVRMPEMDGLEAAAAIRHMERDDAGRIPIIALTANAFDEDVQMSLQAGMNAHLSKPVEPKHLYHTLEELIWESEEKLPTASGEAAKE
ncbi:MAG: amino acid permease [Clostridia bacterium]|nr:amino acid permease [Clostridia bacterium]